MRPAEVLKQALDFHRAGELRQARLCYDFVLRFEPENTDALRLLGRCLVESGDPKAALVPLEKSIGLQPDDTESLHNLGRARRALGQLEEAEALFRRELLLQPGNAEAWSNLGWTLRLAARPEEALQAGRRAVALEPNSPEHWNNLGIAAQAALQLNEADQAYRKAFELRPSYAKARLHLGMLKILQGDWASGFEDYEFRFGMPPHTGGRPGAAPLWQKGPPPVGKTLLLHAEQGLGDTLQFIRYAKVLEDAGVHLVLEVQKPLQTLLAHNFPRSLVLAAGETLPHLDLHCPLMSLPQRLGTEPSSVPFPEAYLRADTAAADTWGSLLETLPRPRIGIVWAGNPLYGNDRTRSWRLDDFLALPSLDQAGLVVLQREVNGHDREMLLKRGGVLLPKTPFADFAETAALASRLDAVVSVDTSVAHLAGALGLPTTVLLPASPDWRWGLGSETTPWYRSLRLQRRPL